MRPGILGGFCKSEGGKYEVKSLWLFRMEVVLSVNFVVLLLSKEVLLRWEEPVSIVLLLSATQGEERPPVLAREEVNKRELEVESSSSWLLFLVPFQAMTGGPIVEGVSPLKSTGILGTNLYGEMLNGQFSRTRRYTRCTKVRLPEGSDASPEIVFSQNIYVLIEQTMA